MIIPLLIASISLVAAIVLLYQPLQAIIIPEQNVVTANETGSEPEPQGNEQPLDSSLEVIGRQPDIIGPAAEQCRPALENTFGEILKTDHYKEFSYISEHLIEIHCNDKPVYLTDVNGKETLPVAYVVWGSPGTAYFNPDIFLSYDKDDPHDYHGLGSLLFHEARHMEQMKDCNVLGMSGGKEGKCITDSWEREVDAIMFAGGKVNKIFDRDMNIVPVPPHSSLNDVDIISNNTETGEVPSSQSESEEEGFVITLPQGVSWEEYEKWQSERQKCYKQHDLEAPGVLVGTLDPNDGHEDEIEREERLLKECEVKPLEEYAAEDDMGGLPPITIENYKGNSARMLPYKHDDIIDKFETINLAMHEPFTIKIVKGSQYREVVISEEEQCCAPYAFVNLQVNESSQASAVYNGAPHLVDIYSYDNRTELAYFLTHRPVNLPLGDRTIPIGEHGIYIGIDFTDGSNAIYAINADIAPSLHK